MISLQTFLTICIVILVLALVWIITSNRGRKRKQRDTIYPQALNYMINEENDAAIKAFTQLVKENTENIDAYIKLGILYRKTGKSEQAIKIHDGLLHRPTLSENLRLVVLRNLVEDYIASGDKENALETAEKILSIQKKHSWALDTIFNLQKELHNWDAASDVFIKVNGRKDGKNRQLALLQVQKGLELYKKREFHDARLTFKKAVRINSSCEAAYYFMAESYIRDERQADAVEWWEKFTAIAPDKAFLVYDSLKRTLFLLGRYSEIKKIYQNVLNKYPDDTPTTIALADFYEKKGDLDQTLYLLEELVDKKPESTEAVIALSRILILKNRGNKADELLNELRNKQSDERIYKCSACDFEDAEMFWLCPRCGQADTVFGE